MYPIASEYKGFERRSKYSAGVVKRMVGGAIDDTKLPLKQQWLGGESGDTCTIRMSRAFNRSNVPIPKNFPGFRTARGGDGFNYGFAVQELHRWMLSHFDKPDIYVRAPVNRDAFAGKKGIIVFDISKFGMNPDHLTRALGHADLWDGRTFYDEIDGTSRPSRDFFTIADAVSLWVCSGTATLPTS